MTELSLPAACRAFLAAGKELDYDAAACECGAVTLLAPEQLAVRRIPVAVAPHDDAAGFFLVAAVSLIERCEHYAPFGVLVWFPARQCFGQYDEDHAVALAFPEARWQDIARDPARWLGAQWVGSTGRGWTRLLPTPDDDRLATFPTAY